MDTEPSTASPTRMLPTSLDKDTTMSNRVEPTARMPIMSLIWDTTMSMATADVNPAFTGPEMKSIKKPAVHGIGNKQMAIVSDNNTIHIAGAYPRGWFWGLKLPPY